ncbi:FAD-dependent oxidoreductase [Bordetella genomosp. 13]|uniref:FAD-dependent oxidoreductase n=1 Tax=Bordetella genomosp. 13 TaxID=463040 RepID=UPI0011A74EE4|nr:FAD-dependent oxidoreductase [Bordetella genomosp. 13]
MEDIDYQAMEFAYARCPDQDGGALAAHPAVVVGAGPVGLSTALDLARQGVRVLVLDDDCRLSTGSRAICFSKRTLEIWDRLGTGQRMVDKGVSWNVGKVFFRDQQVWKFDLLPEAGHQRPAFINLQQYYAEGYLLERARAEPLIELRWKNKVTAVAQDDAGVDLTVETPDGPYTLRAQWLVACDGSRSPVRRQLGLESRGRIFRDRFLIADVKMTADFPAERWFWFDPPFHPEQSVLLHMQPDNVWRIDFQLGWNADPVEAVKPENVLPRIRALLGQDAQFELEWVSVYTFACERMDRFRHGRVLFAGDSAHRVSPFGARGANSGVQDAENLAWKLKLVLAGHAPASLLDSYCQEREYAADENIRNSSRSTDFITPKSEASRVLRNAVLNLAKEHPFARTLVNSGRLSVPATYADSPLNTPDTVDFAGRMRPGAVAADAPVRHAGQDGWWLPHLGNDFVLALFCGDSGPDDATRAALDGLAHAPVPVRTVLIGSNADDAVQDAQGVLAQRYDAQPGTCYLIRPDQHVAARWRAFDPAVVSDALRRATGIPAGKAH